MTSIAKLTTEDLGPAVLARVEGEVDLSAVVELERELWAATDGGDRNLVVDLSRLEFIDSSGLRLLVSLESRLAESSRTLRLVVRPEGSVASVLGMTRLDRVLGVSATPEDAVAGLR